MDNMKELNLNEMDAVTGGAGGSAHMLPDKQGFEVYKIQKGDTLGKIARRYGTTANELQKINSGTIHNVNSITTGYYIYVPASDFPSHLFPGRFAGPVFNSGQAGRKDDMIPGEERILHADSFEKDDSGVEQEKWKQSAVF